MFKKQNGQLQPWLTFWILALSSSVNLSVPNTHCPPWPDPCRSEL